jgi:hypothetical protein
MLPSFMKFIPALLTIMLTSYYSLFSAFTHVYFYVLHILFLPVFFIFIFVQLTHFRCWLNLSWL